jgi:hypothetical protein
MMTSVSFAGWFQSRFATDPDDFDDPRGAQGWTFALDGEPDFDRIIRLENPTAPRSHGPNVGVGVTGVTVGGQPAPAHPLMGASVVLRDGPRFEGHNGDIAPDGSEPVFPFHLELSGGGVSIEIREWLQFADLMQPVSLPRFGRGVSRLTQAEFAALTGHANGSAYRAARLAALQADLPAAAPGDAWNNLQHRIAELGRGDIRVGALTFKVGYGFAIPSQVRAVVDPNHSLGPGDPLAAQWKIEWWMGCWDADALSGYMSGRLLIG